MGVFVVFLITGIWGGRLIGASELVKTAFTQVPDTQDENSVTNDPSDIGQRNLLMIGVDRLNTTNPRLEGIWLVLYFQDEQDFTFLPLFPQPNAKNNSETSELIASFSLDEAGRPSQAFLDLLNHQVWWSNYLIIDQVSLSTLIDLLGGLQNGSLHRSEADVLSNQPYSWQDTNNAYIYQTRLISQLCEQARVTSLSRTTIATTLKKVNANLSTDLNLIDMMDAWFNKTGDSQSLKCEFPLLSSSIP
jgi:hypothetical protein